MKKINKVLLLYAIYPNPNDPRKIQMLGISYLQSAISKVGITCDRIDPSKNNYIFDENEVIKYIIQNNYDMVGFSILSANTELSLKMAEKIKEINNEIIIIFGGMNATVNHDKIIQNKCVDVIIRGEGEVAIIDLINDYNENGKFTYPVKGVTYQSLNGLMYLSNEINQISDLDQLAFPNRQECFDYSYKTDIVNEKKLYNVAISSSRGCPYACTFCAVPSTKVRWRGRTPENVRNEIKKIYEKNKDIFIIFIDDNFFVDSSRALKISKLMFEIENKRIPFSFATRADQIINAGIDVFNQMKEYGLEAVEVGIENGSDSVLKRMKKRVTVKQNEEALRILKEVNIRPGVDFILFDYLTTEAELKENFEFFERNNLIGYYQPLVYNQMYPYPGTEFERFNIDMENYFVDKAVEIVYDKIIRFRNEFQKKIDDLISIMLEKKFHKESLDNFDIIWLQSIPYIVFEKFLYKKEKYDDVIDELKIKTNLQKLKENYKVGENIE